MKTSELIKTLEEMKAKHGDLEVDLWQDEAESSGDLKAIALAFDKHGKPSQFTLCGPNMHESFLEDF